MATALLSSYQNTMRSIGLNVPQAGQVGHVGIYSDDGGDEVKAPLAFGLHVKPSKLVGDTTAALPKANYCQFHSR